MKEVLFLNVIAQLKNMMTDPKTLNAIIVITDVKLVLEHLTDVPHVNGQEKDLLFHKIITSHTINVTAH
jgi:hypothetical protein